jgi:hypothetical protein
VSEAKIVLSAVDETKAAFQSVKTSLEGLQERATSLKEVFEGLAVGLGLGSIAESIRDVINFGDELDKLSQRTGITTEALSRLSYAAQQNGVASDSMTQALKKLNVSINDALAGNTKYAQTFSNLGVQLKDVTGKTLSTDQVILQIANRFKSADDGATKTAYAVALMGRAGDELIPVLNKGSDGIKQLTDQADQLGATVGEDFAKKSDQFNSSLGALKAQTDAWWRQLASQLLPTMQAIVNELIEMKKASDEAGKHSLLGDTLVTTFQTIATLGANVVYVLKQSGIELGGIAAQAAAIARLDFSGAAQIHQMMVQDAQKARQDVDRTGINILTSSGPADPTDAAFGVLNAAVMSGGGAKTALPPVDNSGAAKAAQDAYNNLIETIKKKIEADNQELAAGRALTDFEKYAIDIRTQESKLLEKYPSLNKAVIDSIIATALARNNDVAAMKAQQQNNTNYAKAWEKDEADMAAFEKARADERDRLLATYRQEHDALTDSAQLLQAEGQMLGASDRERQTYLANLQIELNLKRELQKIDEDRLLSPEARDAAKAAAQANADLQHQQVQLNDQLDLWHSIDDTARQAFDNIGQKGTNVFQQLGDALKKFLIDQLYQLTVRPFLMNIVMNVTGQGVSVPGVPGNPFVSGAGSLSNLFSSGSNTFSGMFTSGSIGNFLGASATGVPANPYLGSTAALGTLGEAVPYIGALYAASQGQYGSAAGMAIGTAILPGVGTIVGGLIGSMFDGKGGGPKQDGVFGRLDSGIGQGQRSAASDATAKSSAQAIQSTYDAIVKAYEGTGGLQYGLGFSMDPQGTSPSFVDITASRGNSTAFTDLNLNAGRSQQELQDAVSNMTAKAVLTGLQQSGIQGAIGQYLASLGDIAKLSADDAAAAMNRVQKAMTEKQQLEDQIFQLTATQDEQLAKARKDELDALDDSNKALEQRVFALQDEQKASATLAQALSDAKNSAAQWATFIAGINNNIRGYIDKLNGTSAGGLPPEQQLANARTQFDQQIALGNAKDQNALSNITNYADQLIQAGQGYYGSGTGSANIVSYVKSKLAGLPQMQSTEDYLAQVIKSTSDDQVAATKAASDKIWDGLWGSSGMLAQNFKDLDTNVDGLLSFDELKTALGPLATDDTIGALIKRVDTNGDGMISKQEATNAAVAEAAAVQAQATLDSAKVVSDSVKAVASGSSSSSAAAAAVPKTLLDAISYIRTNHTLFGPDGRSILDFSAVPGFAPGGDFMGGIRIVGERGPELEATGPSRIFNAQQTRQILSGGGDIAALVREVRELRARLEALLSKSNEINATGARQTIDKLGQVVKNTDSSSRRARLDAARV